MERHIAVSTDLPAVEILGIVRQAEELGFAAAWITDIRWLRDAYTVMGAIANATQRIGLASGASDVFARHPVHLAESATALDELAPGRVIVGLAAGGLEIHRLGRSHDHPASTVASAARALRGLLAGDTVSERAGDAFTVADGALLARPSRPVRIAVVAHGPRMFEVAGETADIVVLPNFTTRGGLDWAREHVGRARTRRDSSIGPLEEVLRLDVCVSPDGEEARRFMRRRVQALLGRGYYRNSYLGDLTESDIDTARDGSAPALDRVVQALALVGTPQEVSVRLATILDRSGVGAICLRLFRVGDQRPEETPRMLWTLLADAAVG